MHLYRHYCDRVFFVRFILCMCAHVEHAYVTAHVQRSEDNVQDLVLSFLRVDPRD